MKVKPLHFPTVLGAVVLTYNIPGVTQSLKFTPDTIAGIYLGEIKKWNDPQNQAENAGVKLPDRYHCGPPLRRQRHVIRLHRLLSKVSPHGRAKSARTRPSAGRSGLGGKGNDGVAGLVKQTPTRSATWN